MSCKAMHCASTRNIIAIGALLLFRSNDSMASLP